MKALRVSVLGALLLIGLPAVNGCMTGGAEADPRYYYGELHCDDTSIDSPTERPCREDCIRPCGFNPRSQLYPRADKICECESGVYIECRCPRPDWYKGAAFAPWCDSYTLDGSGMTEKVGCQDLNRCGSNVRWACDTEWEQCVARNPVDGNTPRGCVCMNRGDGTMTWECGSTEKWFAPEQ